MKTRQESNYVFLDARQVSDHDRIRLTTMIENYFHTIEDPNQMQIDERTVFWIKNYIPECAILIKKEQEIVGSTLILPASLKLMERFISGEINEEQLFLKIQDDFISYEQMEAIYLCSAFIVPKYRKNNLAMFSLLRSIRNINQTGKKLPLFYWPYSSVGKKISEKISEILKVSAYARNLTVKNS